MIRSYDYELQKVDAKVQKIDLAAGSEKFSGT